MSKVLFAHTVSDVDHWVSKHSERVDAFAAWGSNVVDYVADDGSDWVIVGVEVHDMEGMQAALASPEIAAAKRSHGVIDPIRMFVQAS